MSEKKLVKFELRRDLPVYRGFLNLAKSPLIVNGCLVKWAYENRYSAIVRNEEFMKIPEIYNGCASVRNRDGDFEWYFNDNTFKVVE